jgi:hypothetical protein
MMQENVKRWMHIYFYFYATTMNIPVGFYTPQNYSYGA